MVDRYNKIETFVCEEEKMHSEWALRCILSYIEAHEITDIRNQIYHKAQELSLCSLRIARFIEQEKARDYNTETGKILNAYGSCVQDANQIIYDYFDKHSKDNYSKSEWESGINKLIEDNNSRFDKLENLRMGYLLAEKKRVLKFAKGNHLEVYL